VTESPSDTAGGASAERDRRAAAIAERVAALVGSETWTADFGTAKVVVAPERWVEAHRRVAAELPFFSWLAAVDWTGDVVVGEPPEDPDTPERYEVMSRLTDVTAGEGVILSTSISKDDPMLDTISGVYGGADWHEREAAEMFGIVFAGHPNLVKLYLPDAFEGHPLRKSFPLLSREVKPWPGTVDVEDMPSAENPET
jgi:NADH-quinone oxidoreductase subunit C